MTARERECANGYVRDPSWAPEEGGKWGPKQHGELTNAPDATQSDRATAVGNAITGPAYRYIFSHLPWLPPRVGGVQPALKVAGRRHPAPNKRRRGANSTPTVNARAQKAADRAAQKRKREDDKLLNQTERDYYKLEARASNAALKKAGPRPAPPTDAEGRMIMHGAVFEEYARARERWNEALESAWAGSCLRPTLEEWCKRRATVESDVKGGVRHRLVARQ